MYGVLSSVPQSSSACGAYLRSTVGVIEERVQVTSVAQKLFAGGGAKAAHSLAWRQCCPHFVQAGHAFRRGSLGGGGAHGGGGSDLGSLC